jgi:hypothetical protein
VARGLLGDVDKPKSAKTESVTQLELSRSSEFAGIKAVHRPTYTCAWVFQDFGYSLRREYTGALGYTRIL